MTISRISFAAVLMIIAGAGASARADEFEHIDSLALSLQRQTRELYNEFGEHYRHASHSIHLRNDAAKMFRLARHIHDVAHVGGSLNHIAADLRQLDQLFHHLEDLVEHIEHDAFHGDGHVHGDTGHVQALMSEIEDTIHHLRADVNELRRGPVGPVVPIGGGFGGGGFGGGHDHGHSHGGGGVSFGSGGVRVRIGF
jgi:hypothetical protein